MKIARVLVDHEAPAWGVVEDDVVRLLNGPLAAREFDGRRIALAQARLLAPVEPSKILCVGRNYDAHRQEMGYPARTGPSVFLKPPTTVNGPGESVELPPPRLSARVEHEAELAVVIGRGARMVSAEQALDHILGYTCANDVTARDVQRSDPYPTRGKGFDTFCPVGPWIETDLDVTPGLAVHCRVNGVVRQAGNTAEMIFSVPELISHLSQFTTLLAGDLVLTGSPAGSGPLDAGDEVEIEVQGVGVLRHGVVASRFM